MGEEQLAVRRLNMDSSWLIRWGDDRILLDPWLLGSEIDGFRWFNEQWHAVHPVQPSEISGEYDAIVISQSYPDHCHFPTLDSLENKPFGAVPKAYRKLKGRFPQKDMVKLLDTTKEGSWQVGSLSISFLDPGNIVDPVYYGIVIRRGQDAIIYFPHGFTLDSGQLHYLEVLNIRLLMTSFSQFKLPFFLGGYVNPGLDNVRDLMKALKPARVVHTHDENKHARGLVKKLAKTHYYSPSEMTMVAGDSFIYLGQEFHWCEL
jgi:hypothetical protein